MAPDINSLPASPRQSRPQPARTSSDTASRRASQNMPPPPVPNHYAPRSPVMTSNEQMPFPLRHPRPLTAVELYLEVEKEQEAVVNRLTRELTALRAQSASVTSNASHSSTSTSASLLPIDISDPNPAHQLTGATHPTPSRRHRSSSSLSARSVPNTPSASAPAATSGTTQSQSSTANVTTIGQSQASADRAAAATRGNLSRQPSISTSLSGRSTPARQSLDIARQPPSAAHRPSLSRDPSYQSQTTTASSTAAHAGTPVPQPLSPTQSITSQHYTETAACRSEMEAVKAENEMLRQRVRALERALRARRRDSSNSDVARSDISTRAPRERDALSVTSSAVVSPEPRSAVSAGLSAGGMVAAWDSGVGGVAPPRERSESQSTTASSRRGTVAASASAVEDEVRLGESAGSLGVGRER